jgi:glycosyltransferase involved in cell wall biosynthesis
MKVLLISNYLPDAQQSMLRYAEMLKRGLNSENCTVELVTPPVVFGGLPFLKGPLKKWIGYIDKYFLASGYLRKKSSQADIVHICDHSNSMYLQYTASKPTLVTCHDLIAVFSALGKYQGTGVGFTGRILQRWIASSLVRAKQVVCVSEKTLEDVRTLAPEMRADMRVIHHPLNWSYSPASQSAITEAMIRNNIAADTEYLLHVGGNQWYKNRLGAMQIFAELRKFPRFKDVKLVMAGKPWTPEMRQFCKEARLETAVFERVALSNEDLQALYSGALALIFPSREEGFGWPILEAQACGCPVITSNRAPMTEIAGNAALFIDPDNPECAAQTIAERAGEFSLLRQAGFENLTRFTVHQAISAYLEVYEQTIDGHKAQSVST